MDYNKSIIYTNYKKIYEHCSGPGGLALAEFMAEKMSLVSGKRMVDIGFNRGYQTCFLAKEYDVDIVAIDPWDDRETGIPHVDILMQNANDFGVSNKILGVKSGLPNSLLPSFLFDYAYSTTTMEMIRGMLGKDAYTSALKEIYRILKKGGVFGLGEPMHFNTSIPGDLEPFLLKNEWAKCFATIEETKTAIIEAGFTIKEAGYCEDAQKWWNEYATYDPCCIKNPEHEDIEIIHRNNNRWLSFGYVIAIK